MYTPILIPRVILIWLSDHSISKEEMYLDFEEAESLINTFGGKVYAALAQNMTRADYSTFIGRGKVDEAVGVVLEKKIDIVVINATLTPSQLHTLFLAFHRVNPHILVWDRISLILEIFSKHASTSQAKLQIKFAKMRQMGPRIYGMGMQMSSQAAGIGARGLGETNTKLMLRHWRSEKTKVQKELNTLSKKRSDQIDRRKKDGLSTISLVGYTNAGKTTLFNRLTGLDDLVKDKLFSTLDSTVNKFYLKSLGHQVYVSDTIGFIKNLPPILIDAFKSTLLQAVHADLIVNVIDSSDSRMDEKIATVQEILEQLQIERKNIMYVFNKIEKNNLLEKEKIADKFKEFSPHFISAKNGDGVDELMKSFGARLV